MTASQEVCREPPYLGGVSPEYQILGYNCRTGLLPSSSFSIWSPPQQDQQQQQWAEHHKPSKREGGLRSGQVHLRRTLLDLQHPEHCRILLGNNPTGKEWRNCLWSKGWRGARELGICGGKLPHGM